MFESKQSMKLQIALDDITREAAKVLLEKIQEDVDIIEIGTPFAYYNDISVIQEFKNLYHKAKFWRIQDSGRWRVYELLLHSVPVLNIVHSFCKR